MPLTATGQDSIASLKITFLDPVSKLPVSDVVTALVNGDKLKSHTITNGHGTCFFNKLTIGTQQIQTYHLGYRDTTITVNLIQGTNTDSIFLTTSKFNLGAVKIIGIRPNDPMDASGAVSKMSIRQMQQIAATGTQEALEYIPGVSGFSDDGMGNSRINIGIRGLHPRRSNRTLILEDGIPIQPALYVYSNMYYNPPVERIREVEVIKGSASTEYGPQTMGGVVNYVTNRPRKDFGGRVSLVGGTNGYATALAEVGGWGNAKVRPEIQVLYKTGNGYRENNHFDQYNGTFKLFLVPNKKRRIYINLNANYEQAEATYTGLTPYSFENDIRFNPKDNDIFTIQRYAFNILQQRKINANLEENTKIYFNYFDRDWWREYDTFVSASEYENGLFNPISLEDSRGVDDLIRVGNENSNFGILRTFMVAGADHQYEWEHSFKEVVQAKLHVGGRIHFERFKDLAGNGDDPNARTIDPYRANNYETYAYSFFAREHLRVEDFTLSTGIRFELFEQEMVNRLNGNALFDATTFNVLPGIGFNYKLYKTNFFGGIHRGMTPPSNGTLLTLNFGQTDGTTFDGLDLKSETSWTKEIGIRTNMKLISGELAFFHLSIDNLIAAARGTTFTSLDRVTSQGIESNITVQLNQLNTWLPNFFLTYTYLETEIVNGVLTASALNDSIRPDVSGNELPYAPRHNFIFGMVYNWNEKFELMVNYRYVSKSWTDYENINFRSNRGDTGPVPIYRLLNASLTYRVNEKFRTFLTAKNILDTKYIGSRLHSNPRQQNASSSSGIIPGPTRQINLGINYNF